MLYPLQEPAQDRDEIALAQRDDEDRRIVDEDADFLKIAEHVGQWEFQGPKAGRESKKTWYQPERMELFRPLISAAPPLSDAEAAVAVERDPWTVPLHQRWQLYQYWMRKGRR